MPELADTLREIPDLELRENEPLVPWTSVRIGGPAECWVRPRSAAALVTLLARIRELGVPLSILGGGANTLVADGGIPGVTLKLPPDLLPEEVETHSAYSLISLCAGSAIARLIQQMKSHRRVGAEFLAGIPGTLGGALTMNAGTKNGECISVVDAVELATGQGVGWVPRAELTWGYRFTRLPESDSGAVVTRVRFRLPAGDLQASRVAMEADLAYRKRTQPLSLPNFGSVFTNPPGGHAGVLIEGTGLKGHTAGRAQISTLHANWIVNLGGARASDVSTLIELARKRVVEQTGIVLVPEVKRMGRFDP